MGVTLAEELDGAIKVVCPIDGVSIGIPLDKTTWRIDFMKNATDKQKSDARAVVTAFVPTPSTPIDRTKRKADLAGANTIADIKAILQDLL